MTIKVFDYIGRSGLDSMLAVKLVNETIAPHLIQTDEKVILDFSGITNVNSSFINALFLDIFMKFGSKNIQEKLKITNCRSNIVEIVEAGLEYADERSKELIAI
ncbi:STAS-like domain-containing protein [Leptospira bandrabouensis]|uniref:STAS-like domain-containing protein n=1 Tax=Leptospira bandrabouensis TaxID=2484903 RepID=UPI00223E1CB7|nr:STAS-like domain-containing protein [Leptospira bandrabouensis]MCW7460188.1 STAS-like domain-containing protein [Leptospira bandrabouensis]MCW7479350.1 STAS-like domain-containing protein [Leptospira bandrabouensis]MCW7487032.1 STAS-like domain-containing protein [Leptospira bandrabouensis]